MRTLNFVGALIVVASSGSCKHPDQSEVKEVEAIDYIAEKNWAGNMGIFLGGGGAGVEVLAVAHFGFADVIGIKPKDIITKLNGRPVNNIDAFQAQAVALAVDPTIQSWVFDILRNGEFISLTTVRGYRCSRFHLIGCGPAPVHSRAHPKP
jgi:S1-C subfamily serine protease